MKINGDTAKMNRVTLSILLITFRFIWWRQHTLFAARWVQEPVVAVIFVLNLWPSK